MSQIDVYFGAQKLAYISYQRIQIILNLNKKKQQMNSNIVTTPTKLSTGCEPYKPVFSADLRRKSTVFHQQQLDLQKMKASSQRPSETSSQCHKPSYQNPKNSQNNTSASSFAPKITHQVQKMITQLLEPHHPSGQGQKIINMDSLPQIIPIGLVADSNCGVPHRQTSQKSQSSNKQTRQNRNKYHYKIAHSQQHQHPIPKTLNPNTCLTIKSDLPPSVIQTYDKQHKRCGDSLNFIQGYLRNADYIYYSIEKKLVLHRAAGPRLVPTTDNIQQDITMQLPDILYNIVQTGVDIRSLCLTNTDMVDIDVNMQSGQVLIMCHPYSLQLYYLLVNKYYPGAWYPAHKTFNPICKLQLKLSLPDCSQPTNILLSGQSIYYLPDNQLYALNKINIQTNQITKIQLQTPLAHNIPNTPPIFPSTTKSTPKFTQYLLGKLISKITNLTTTGWLTTLATRYVLDINVERMVGCCHGCIVMCLVGVRVKDGFSWLFDQLGDGQLRRNKVQRFITIYINHPNTTTTTNTKQDSSRWTTQTIKPTQQQQLLTINILPSKYKQPCQCQLSITVLQKLYNKIQTHRYQIYYRDQWRQGSMQPILKLYPVDVTLTVRLDRQCCRQQLMVAVGEDQGQMVYGERLVRFGGAGNSRSSIQLNIDKSVQQVYVYKSKNIGQSLVLTNTGYTNIITITYLDWLYTLISTYKPKTTTLPIQQLSNHILQHAIALHPKYPISALCTLLNNLLLLAVGSTGQQGCVNGYEIDDEGVWVRCRRYGVESMVRNVAQSVYVHLSAKLEYIIRDIVMEEELATVINTQSATHADKLTIILNAIQQNISKAQSQPQTPAQSPPTPTPTPPTDQNNPPHKYSLQIQPTILTQTLLKINLSTTISAMLHKIWQLPLIEISNNKIDRILESVDCLVKICQKQRCIGIVLDLSAQKRVDDFYCDKIMKSPVSTLAYSYYSSRQQSKYNKYNSYPTHHNNNNNPIQQFETYPQHQPHQQPNTLHKLTQFLQICQLLKHKHKTLKFTQAYQHTPYYFVPDLFDFFVEDYDPELLMNLNKVIPMYLMQLCPNYGERVERKMLRYWLSMHVELSGISNSNKVVKLLSKKWKQYRLTSQSTYNSNHNNNNSNKSNTQLDKKQLIIPKFFLKYLHKYKKTHLTDIINYQQSDPELASLTTSPYNYIYEEGQFLINNTNNNKDKIDNSQYRCSEWKDDIQPNSNNPPPQPITPNLITNQQDIERTQKSTIQSANIDAVKIVKGGIDLEMVIKIDSAAENSSNHKL